ncbi:MAG: hypothetical protein WC307_02140 [Candidatus Nanoarchaeia archaeon]
MILLISFIGVDGSGKTTFAKKTFDYLTEKGCKVALIKPFEYLFLKNYLKNKNADNILNQIKKPFYYKFWSFLALVDNIFYYHKKIKPLLKKYDYVICDRYFYDFVMSFLYHGFIFNWFSKVYLKLLPKPDLTFIMSLKPKLAMKREVDQKHKYIFYETQDRNYKLINYLGFSIDNSNNLDKNLQKILRLILKFK